MSDKFYQSLERYGKDLVYIVGLTTTVVFFIVKPMNELQNQINLQAKDINLIQTNHLAHIQASMEKIQASMEDHEREDAEIAKQVYELSVGINEIKLLLKR